MKNHLTNSNNKCRACLSKTVPFCKLPIKFDISETLLDKDFINYSYCPKCLTIQQNPVPSEKYLNELVRKEYSKSKKKLNFNIGQTNLLEYQHFKMVNILNKYKIKDNILDVGAGVGTFCSVLLGQGIKCSGIEISPELVKAAKKRKIPINKKALFDMKSFGKYKAITMSHVFEHLSDPEAYLKHIYKLLKPNGLFLSIQPTAAISHLFTSIFRFNNHKIISPLKFNYINLNRWHIIIFSIKGMSLIGKRNGFELIDVIPMPSLKTKGITNLIFRIYTTMNVMAGKIFPGKWPLQVAYLFVFRKIS